MQHRPVLLCPLSTAPVQEPALPGAASPCNCFLQKSYLDTHLFPSQGDYIQAAMLPQQPALSIQAAPPGTHTHTACSCRVKVSQLSSPQSGRTSRRQPSCPTASHCVPTTHLAAWSCRALADCRGQSTADGVLNPLTWATASHSAEHPPPDNCSKISGCITLLSAVEPFQSCWGRSPRCRDKLEIHP